MSELVTDTPDIPIADLMMSKDMAEALHAEYPGHLWAVQVIGEQGVCYIRNLALSGNYGYTILLPQVYSASDFRKQVVRGGGEILERFKQRRGAVDHDALAAMPVDRVGNVIGDRSR